MGRPSICCQSEAAEVWGPRLRHECDRHTKEEEVQGPWLRTLVGRRSKSTYPSHHQPVLAPTGTPAFSPIHIPTPLPEG